MTRKMPVHLMFILLIVVCLSGCPNGTAQIAPGVWLLEYDLSNSVLGLAIMGDGSVLQPVPLPAEADSSFAGVMSWVQNDSQFVLTWTSAGTFVFIAQVNSSENLSGTWVEVSTGNTGAWSARRVS